MGRIFHILVSKSWFAFLLMFLPQVTVLSQVNVITGPSVVCYDNKISLVHSLSGTNHQWEYGTFGGIWKYNTPFDMLRSHIFDYYSRVYETYPDTTVNLSSVYSAINSTDFHFMVAHFSLYGNPDVYKSTIADMLSAGVDEQNYNKLSLTDRAFLTSYFHPAVMSYSGCPPPYTPDVAWQSMTLGTSQTIDLNGSIYGTPQANIVTIAVRVSITPGAYSTSKLIDIKPQSPTFKLEADKSCPNDNTGQIKLKDISGLLPGNKYFCNIKRAGDESGIPYSFTGTGYTASQKYGQGVYNVFLYYDDQLLGGCGTSETITIGTHPDLEISASATEVSCHGYADGTILTSVISSHETVEFTINSTDNKFTGLKAKTYTVKATDGCHPAGKEEFLYPEVKEPSEVLIDEVLYGHPTCNSNANGAIEIKLSGGVSASVPNPNYVFRVYDDNEDKSSSPLPSAKCSFNDLSGGTYTVQARAEKCEWKTASTTYTLTPVQPIQLTISKSVNVKCFGGSEGEIQVNASGGQTPYIYEKNGTTIVYPDGLQNLTAGTYNITVKSNGGAGCNDIASTNVTITTPTEIKINPYEIKNVNCNGDSDGSIQTIVNGGTNVFSYIWLQYINNAWSTIQNETSSSLMNIEAGDYRLSVTDSWGCSKSLERKITQPDKLNVVSVTPKDVVCLGENGSLDIVASGGTTNYQYFCTRENDDYVVMGSNSILSVPAGEYSVEVRDAHGCQTTYPVTLIITEPYTELDFELSSPEYNGFNIPCSGDLLGSITVNAWGGNDYDYNGYTYSISGSPYQVNETFNNLAAGTYSINAKDGRGCIVSKPFILTEPDPLHLTVLPTEHVKCFGEPTGKIMVLPDGGIENTYKYKLDGNDMLTPGLFEHLYAGTYEIEVSDENGCRHNVFETVNHLYPPISIAMLPQDVRCYNEGNGTINTVVSGGSGGFTYLWELQDGEQWQLLAGTADNRTSLVPGYYRIKATDSESCFLYAGEEINQPEEFLIPESLPKDIVCLGEKGSINITAIGGNGDNKYFCREKAGAVFESNDPLLQLPAGTFTVDAMDKKGCLAAYAVGLTITEPDIALDFKTELSSYTGYGVSCYGKSDGIIIFEASGGNSYGYSGYKFSVSGSPFDANNHYSYLPKGLHTVRVTDGRGCIVQKSVELTEPPELAVNLLHSKPVPCFGKPTGEIKVEATGGIENTYLYTLDGKEFPSGLFAGLHAGKHRVAVEDLNGCLANLFATVDQTNPAILTNLSSLNVRCYGENNGQINSDITGGTGSYSISWEKKTGKEWHTLTGNNDTLKDVVAGFYRIKTIDTDDCIAYDSIEVKEPEKLAISMITINDAACFGDKGGFEIKTTGGNDGNEFYCSADNGLSFTPYSPGTPIAAGSYLLKASDSKGCISITPETYTITNPEKPLSFECLTAKYSGYDISCHGNDDGKISVKASGGNGNNYRGYYYSLSGSEESHENVFDSLAAGNYDITVTDGRGCRLIKTITLTEPESQITLKASSFKRPLCIYDKSGEVKLSASGGTQPYKYSANDGFYSDVPDFTGLLASKYTFRVKDVNGCVETFDTTMTSLVSQLNITADITDVKCFNEKTGLIEVSTSGGARPYTYSWKDNSYASSKASGLGKGSYTVSVTDREGCKAEKTFEIKQPELPLRVTATSTSACAETRNGQISITASGGTAPYRYAVDNKSDLTAVNTFNVFPGVHKAFTFDANNCVSETSVDVAKRNLMPEVNFMLATSRFELDTLVILDVSVPKPDKVSWSFSDDAVIIDTSSNKARIKYNQSGIYPVTMTGLFGTCSYSIEKLLNIAPFDPKLAEKDKNNKGIKSVKISPNPNDGRFELRIELYSKQDFVVKVFDLYSRLIYNESYSPETDFTEEIILPESVMPGTYVLWILTEYDAHSSVFIISE